MSGCVLCTQVGGGKDESVMQPLWGPSGELYFISDRTGFWNLYRLGTDGQVAPVLKVDAEFGGPAWMLGQRSYQVLQDGRCGSPLMLLEGAGSHLSSCTCTAR